MSNKFKFPYIGFGMGLRTNHYAYILKNWPKTDWFEIISENFMDTEGKPIRILEKVREHYPVVMHGVSLSIGTTDPMNSEYLKKLKKLSKWLNPPWVSDHLCWTGVAHKNTHDLLPVPYTEEALKHIIKKIKQVQDYMERPLVLENPSTYMEFASSSMPEWEFIARMAEGADCGLLLDVNNVYVSAYNHRFDPKEYIDAIPKDRVVQIHLAGHKNLGTHILDTHGGKVIDDVWALYRYTVSKMGKVSTMVEWDDLVPSFKTVQKEVEKARKFAEKPETPNSLPDFSDKKPDYKPVTGSPYKDMLGTFQKTILSGNINIKSSRPANWIRNKPGFPEEKQIGVYVSGYRNRLFEISNEDYPALRNFLGDKKMDELLLDYIEATPSTSFNISRYTIKFPAFVKTASCLSAGKRKFAYEIALAETEMWQIFDMQETRPLNPKKFAKIAPEKFLKEKLRPRIALKLFVFDYPVNDYIEKIQRGKKPAAPKKKKTWLAIYRHKDNILRLALEKSEFDLLNLLITEKNVGEAIGSLMMKKGVDERKLPEYLNRWFRKWASNGVLAA